jgi:hypothetical protein
MLYLALAGICVSIFGVVWVRVEWHTAKHLAELELENYDPNIEGIESAATPYIATQEASTHC